MILLHRPNSRFTEDEKIDIGIPICSDLAGGFTHPTTVFNEGDLPQRKNQSKILWGERLSNQASIPHTSKVRATTGYSRRPTRSRKVDL